MIVVTNTPDRKELVRAISEELRIPAVYLRAPTYSYRIGEFIVDKSGNIIGDNFEALRDFLRRNGYMTDEVLPAGPDSEAERVDSMEIAVPAEDITPLQLKNLVFILYSKQILINRMVRSDRLGIPAALIDRLKESTPDTLEEFTELLGDSEITGFDFREGKVILSFPFDGAQPERWTAFANLLARIVEAAKKATRVFPEVTVPDEQNEKYLAHVWLQRLGYHGADFKAERKILLGHLTGYCAFSDNSKMQAHKEKFAAIRRERRSAEEADENA